MASRDLDEIIKRAELLAPEEQLLLISRLAEKARQTYQNQIASPSTTGLQSHQRKWTDIHGHAPYPMVGEDAQQWVSRSRQEANQHREYPGQRDSGDSGDSDGMSGTSGMSGTL